METALDILSWVLLLGGGAFVIIGGVGLLRLPDFYTRLHAAGMTDTLGAGLIILGMMVEGGLSLVTVKLVLLGALIFLTSPTATHAIANAAFTAGLEPWTGDDGAAADQGEASSSKA
ncbi:MAG: monovalent cation/H(+) antiporter subunit G [Proteobacteria bacterium]|nr:monovalent cation/H(+) antiporter subunit G [Pseudomonadota bacterium]